MSVEQKIQKLLERANDKQLDEVSGSGDQTQPQQGSSQKASFSTIASAGNKPSVATGKDKSKAGEKSGPSEDQPKQGSSDANPKIDDLGSPEDKQPAVNTSKDSSIAGKGSGQGDKKQPKQGSSDIKLPESVDISSQLDSIFGEDLSEDFKTKATSIFEAAVIARVNAEMETVTEKLEEQAAEQLVEFKEALVEKVDGYLNYVVEQYMEENKLAITSGLRAEIAEDFISGLKTLFQESYIEVPEEKFDVVEALQVTNDELKTKLDEAISSQIELTNELSAVKREQVIAEQTQGLAATEAEKLKKLLEGVDFDNTEVFTEKVAVIKENYFPKTGKPSPEQTLVEESGTNPTAFDDGSAMSRYVQTLSRTVKSR